MRKIQLSKEMQEIVAGRRPAAMPHHLGRRLGLASSRRIDEFGGYHSPDVADAVATAFFDQMTSLTGNSGGAIQTLPPSYLVYGRRRGFIASLALAAQAANTVIGVARLPLPYVMTDITLVTDTSLGTATIALGDANSNNFLMAAQTLTAVDSPQKVGKTAALGVPQFIGYDCLSGAQVTYAAPGQGGAGYEDIEMTTAVAALPAAGNLRIFFEFMLD